MTSTRGLIAALASEADDLETLHAIKIEPLCPVRVDGVSTASSGTVPPPRPLACARTGDL